MGGGGGGGEGERKKEREKEGGRERKKKKKEKKCLWGGGGKDLYVANNTKLCVVSPTSEEGRGCGMGGSAWGCWSL